jgi:hypothetical protein
MASAVAAGSNDGADGFELAPHARNRIRHHNHP